jgi:hypothetical protein
MKKKQDAISAADPHLAVFEEAAEEFVSPKLSRRRGHGFGYWLWLTATSIVVGAVLVSGGWVLLNRKPAPASGAGDSLASTADTLPPPPPLAIAIAGPAKGEAAVAADCQRALSKMSLIAEALGPDLRSVGTNSASAVALPDQRQAGHVAPLPAYQRWEVRLAPGTNQETYARGLDYFGIELGVIGGAKEVVYLSKFSQPKPEQRTGPSRKDHRLYMIWQGDGTADQTLAIRAGLTLQDKIIAQFYPPEVEKQLADLERAYAEEHQHKTIEKTIFAMKAQGDGFVFYVMDQQARKQ